MASKRKQQSCTLKDKTGVLSKLDKKESTAKVSSEFGVGKAMINAWQKNRDKI